ncbi:hypothetical protein DIPPA_03992 [Diplonema papillatum]|nr:hypothetical protein DIPPA_03992 [Diplonema papillatum]
MLSVDASCGGSPMSTFALPPAAIGGAEAPPARGDRGGASPAGSPAHSAASSPRLQRGSPRAAAADTASPPPRKKNLILSLFSPLSPRPRPKDLEPSPLSWTREEDNEARSLRAKLSAAGLEPWEADALTSLEQRERTFLDSGMELLSSAAVLLVTMHCGWIPEKNARVFAEVKLRSVLSHGKILSTHDDPQKFTTKAVPPVAGEKHKYAWEDEQTKLLIRAPDALRVSLYTSRVVGKEKVCSVDVRLANLLPKLKLGAPGRRFALSATKGYGRIEFSIRRL